MNDQQLRNILTHRTIGSERLQRNAAILLPLVTVDGRDALLFEVRSKRLEMQPGEICFPGGRIESGETPERAGAVGGTAHPILAGDSAGTHG